MDTKNKNINCNTTQYNTNQSIFDYVIDKSRFVNHNECNNYNPPFLTYIPSGIPNMNIDIENDLKGITKPITKCTECKYYPENRNLVQITNFGNSLDIYPNNKKQC